MHPNAGGGYAFPGSIRQSLSHEEAVRLKRLSTQAGRWNGCPLTSLRTGPMIYATHPWRLWDENADIEFAIAA